MGYAAGSPTGTTGVGSSENATGQSQQAGFSGTSGGKGGGAASLPQPAQSSTANTATPAPAPVYGSNPAMRLNRPGGRMMDPSASMPTAPQTQAPGAAPTTPPPAAGGKGGGYGDIANDQGFKDFLEFYNTQQTSPNAEDNKPGSSVYEATDKFAAPTTSAETEKTAINNPYEMQMKTMQQDFDQRMKDLESKYGAPKEEIANPYEEKYNTLQAELDALKAEKAAATTKVEETAKDEVDKKLTQPAKDEFETLKDEGAKVNPLGPGYDEYGYKTQDQAAAETKAAADKAAAEKAAKEAIPDYYTNKDYKYDTYADYSDEDVANMSDKEVKSLYGSRLTTATADVKQATADYNAAMKSGDIKKVNAAKANLEAQKAEVTKIKADQKRRTDAAKAKAAAAKAAAAAEKKRLADEAAAKKKAEAAAKKAEAAAKKAAKKTTTKKATGGIIHNGMSNRLKHMLGE